MTTVTSTTGSARTRRIIAVSAAFAVSLASLSLAAGPVAGKGKPPAPPGNPDPKGQLVEVQLLAFNDYHGHLERDTPGNINLGDEHGDQAAGGSEFLSAKLTELRRGNKYSLTVAAGDLVGGTPFLSGFFKDEPSVESLNAMGLDVSSVGNHEFDRGVTELLRMQYGGCHPVDGCYFPDQPFAGADFQWLAANTVSETTGETPLPPYWIRQFENVKIGFIGMTLEATDTLVAQAGIQGWKFLDEAETANALVPELRAQGVEAIVVLLHEGGAQASTRPVNGCVGISGPIMSIVAQLDPAIDAVITGHTHEPYNCSLLDPAGNPRPVTSAFSFGRVVSEVRLVIDKRTKDVRRDLTTATNHPVIQAQLAPDPVLSAIIAKWSPLADELGNDVLGRQDGDIRRAFVGNSENRGAESSAGNLIADAQLWATAGAPNNAVIALMNPGGIRADLPYASSSRGEGDGVISYREAFTMQPFSNILMTIPMTGAQIVAALEQQCQPVGSSRPFLHLGTSKGLTYDLAWTQRTTTKENPAPHAPTVTRDCIAVSVTNVKLNGTALDMSASYQVTINNFLADGGDNFPAFAINKDLRIGAGIDLDALVAYLAFLVTVNVSTITPDRIPTTITNVAVTIPLQP